MYKIDSRVFIKYEGCKNVYVYRPIKKTNNYIEFSWSSAWLYSGEYFSFNGLDLLLRGDHIEPYGASLPARDKLNRYAQEYPIKHLSLYELVYF